MILVGRYLSPFVRRTAVVMKLLDLPYEQRELSTADQADEIAKFNPVGRVPALVLDDGEVLVDSAAIIDHLLETADPEHRLLPAGGPDRREVLRLVATGLGVCEKGVASSYERNRRPEDKIYQDWVDRVDGQSAGGLAALDQAASGRDWLCGDGITLADITAAVAHDFIGIAVPYLMQGEGYPALAALSARCAELPAFAETRFRR
ncbi:MAG: glutathione S-transferase family protein [Alphaproteobacteria bacterium]|jgi:glutathione S-transferase|nr:glutathione S-transferase family protein [Alphaproteobacteria bacterium]MDP6565635.1 glutathione S-transferase family protein [Alphaproteobacteria bacterium]MDP6813250.1 glutathione S-transferase family protein [Alphaproteobacteria bacterium]